MLSEELGLPKNTAKCNQGLLSFTVYSFIQQLEMFLCIYVFSGPTN